MRVLTKTYAIAVALAAVALVAAPISMPAVAAARMAPSAAAAAATSITTDGIFKVGTDIRVGIYLGVLRSGSSFGQYSRLKCKTDTRACRNDWGFVGLGQQVLTQIKSSDKYFKSSGIEWATVTKAPVYVKSTSKLPNSGMYRVGKDMRAGTWRGTVKTGAAGALGVYQRLTCLDTTQAGCVVDSETVNGLKTVTVKIAKTDKYFRTSGFGTWTRTGN
ncbi:MAG: hypothetical protein EBS41_05520 [Actinobacteria bacterium]|nr:hypothetical protein [Actinomycetota bacterium]